MSEHLPSDEPVTNCCTREAATCKTCGDEKEAVDCWNCGGEGLTDHDCGEDCCCCLDPEPNVRCDICNGAGFYHVCQTCHPESFDE